MNTQKADEAIEKGVWSSSKNINRKLNEAFGTSSSAAVILFILVPNNNFYGVARMISAVQSVAGAQFRNEHKDTEREADNNLFVNLRAPPSTEKSFRIDWLCKQNVPCEKFNHVRTKDNVDGTNKSPRVASCRDGTEISQFSGVEMLRIFGAQHAASRRKTMFSIDPNWVILENHLMLLMNPQSSQRFEFELLRTISPETQDGDYVVELSPDGRYLAAGSKFVEVFCIATGERLWKFHPDESDVLHGASFNPSMTQLAAGGEGEIIYVSPNLVLSHCSSIENISRTNFSKRYGT